VTYKIGFGVDDRIYLQLVNNILQITIFDWKLSTSEHTRLNHCSLSLSVYQVRGFTGRCLVASFNGGRSPFSGFPNFPRAQLPARHFSQLQLSVCSTTTQSQSRYYVTTDGQSASLSWNKAPTWGLRPDFYY
jgi:hypothetical protein